MSRKKRHRRFAVRLGHTIRGWFWFLLVMLVGIAFQNYVPLEGAYWWAGLVVLALVVWIVVSKLRERLRF